MAEALSDKVRNIEHEVILENLSFIIEGLTYQLYPVCVKFVEKRLISDYEFGNIKSQPAYDAGTEIMRSIKSKVKANPKLYYRFISALEDDMVNVAERLNKTLEEKKDQHNPYISPRSDKPFIGTNELPSKAMTNNPLKRSISCPEYAKNVESESVAVLSTPESESELYNANVAPANLRSELQLSTSETSGLQASNSDAGLLHRMRNHVFTDQELEPMLFSHRSNSFSVFTGSSEHNSWCSKPDVINMPLVEEESDVDEPWTYVFVVNPERPWQHDCVVKAPFNDMKDKKFWNSNSKIERDLSLGKSLEQQLEDKNSEVAILRSQLEKSQAELEKLKAQVAADNAEKVKVQEVIKQFSEILVGKWKAECQQNKIILKLRKEIEVLRRDLKFERCSAEKNAELHFMAAAWLKKTTKELSMESKKKFK